MYNGEPHIIADGILSLIKDGNVSAHGSTLKEARESLVYRLKQSLAKTIA